MASANLCVSQAMQADLQKRFKIRARVLYDRATARFRPLALPEKHELFSRLGFQRAEPQEETKAGETLFTHTLLETGEVAENSGRPLLVLSSTSYTPDEDFGILVDAIDVLEERVLKNPHEFETLPHLFIVPMSS